MMYRKPEPITREDAEAAFQGGNPQEISVALVSLALYDPNWRWVESYCLQYLEDVDAGIRGVAATCLGHLARIHGTIDTDIVIPALETHLSDPGKWVAGKVEDALSDIKMFVKKPSSIAEYLHSEENKKFLAEEETNLGNH